MKRFVQKFPTEEKRNLFYNATHMFVPSLVNAECLASEAKDKRINQEEIMIIVHLGTNAPRHSW